MSLADAPPARTGILSIDAAVRRRPTRSVLGRPVIADPTDVYTGIDRTSYLNSEKRCPTLREIDRAYDVDSYVRQGVDKYVELCLKHGYVFAGESEEPLEYVRQRTQLMSLMTGNCFDNLINGLVYDFIAYGNAFWIKKRQRPPDEIPGLPTTGAYPNAFPVLGYFRADPRRMQPVFARDGRTLAGWTLNQQSGKPIPFKLNQVIHFPYNRKPGELWGCSSLAPVLEDVRAYRRCEEYMIKLLHKHLNPLLHHKTPGADALGLGRQEDVDLAARNYQIIAPDGWIITPPGHEISMIGAESHALRGEGYMQLMRERLYAGLGVNQVVMGDAAGASAGSADIMTANMHNKAKLYQQQLGRMLTEYVVYELLIEGNYSPLLPADRVYWLWNEIETETQIKRENHAIQLWTNGVLTEDEVRRMIGKKPLKGKEKNQTHVYLVKIPAVMAQAEVQAARFGNSDGGDAQSRSRDNPSNQHGSRGAPKIKPK
jgi:hypothetical protein